MFSHGSRTSAAVIVTAIFTIGLIEPLPARASTGGPYSGDGRDGQTGTRPVAGQTDRGTSGSGAGKAVIGVAVGVGVGLAIYKLLKRGKRTDPVEAPQADTTQEQDSEDVAMGAQDPPSDNPPARTDSIPPCKCDALTFDDGEHAGPGRNGKVAVTPTLGPLKSNSGPVRILHEFTVNLACSGGKGGCQGKVSWEVVPIFSGVPGVTGTGGLTAQPNAPAVRDEQNSKGSADIANDQCVTKPHRVVIDYSANIKAETQFNVTFEIRVKAGCDGATKERTFTYGFSNKGNKGEWDRGTSDVDGDGTSDSRELKNGSTPGGPSPRDPYRFGA